MVNINGQILNLGGQLVVPLVRLETLELLLCNPIIISSGARKPVQTFFGLLVGKLLLMFPATRLGTFVDLSGPLGTQLRPCDISTGNSTRLHLLLLLDGLLGLFLVAEVERHGIHINSSILGENMGSTFTNTHGVCNDHRVDVVTLGLGIGILHIRQAYGDGQSHAILQDSVVLRIEDHVRITKLNTNSGTNILREVVLQLRLLRPN